MAGIALLVCIGYLIARAKWVSRDTELFIPKLITKVVLPPYLMYNILQYFDQDQLFHMISRSLAPIMSMALCFMICRCLAPLFRIEVHHRGLFSLTGTVSNTILIGIPVNIALFGDSSLPYVLLYFFANTLFFWTYGCYVLSNEGTKAQTIAVRERIKNIFSPPLCGVILGIVLVSCNVTLPGVVEETCKSLGQLATPLALLFVGITLERVEWSKTHMGLDILTGMCMRLLVSPCILYCLLSYLPLPREMASVFIIQSALPCMAVVPVMSAFYGADKEYASTMVAVTTVGGMLTVPLWMTILHAFPLGG